MLENRDKIYGEYEVPFTLAKDYTCYRFNVQDNLSVKELKDKLAAANYDNNYLGLTTHNVLIVQEFGNIDIELSVYGVDDNKKMVIAFIICANYKDIGWQSEDILDLEFSIDMLNEDKSIEELMYNTLIDYARAHKLDWSREN